MARLARFLALAVLTVQASAGENVVSPERARAAFIFQVAQYAEWPPNAFSSPGASVRFCVLASDNSAEMLRRVVEGKSIQGRPVSVHQIRNPEHLSVCHVGFIGTRDTRELREVLTGWNYPPVLLIGEAPRFAELGGMINLLITDGRLAFEVNRNAVGRAGLTLRSQLLRFARIVPDAWGGGR